MKINEQMVTRKISLHLRYVILFLSFSVSLHLITKRGEETDDEYTEVNIIFKRRPNAHQLLMSLSSLRDDSIASLIDYVESKRERSFRFLLRVD